MKNLQHQFHYFKARPYIVAVVVRLTKILLKPSLCFPNSYRQTTTGGDSELSLSFYVHRPIVMSEMSCYPENMESCQLTQPLKFCDVDHVFNFFYNTSTWEFLKIISLDMRTCILQRIGFSQVSGVSYLITKKWTLFTSWATLVIICNKTNRSLGTLINVHYMLHFYTNNHAACVLT